MDDNFIPYKVYETTLARSDRRFKLMWLLIIVLFVALMATNIGWIVFEGQYSKEVTTIETSQDGSGVNVFNGGVYGSEGEDNSK